MAIVYISGPIRDARGPWYVEQNIRRAEAVAAQLWQAGYAVICPHTNTRNFDGLISPEAFIAGDLEMVARSDVVVMVGDWEKSQGAKAELAHARKLGIPAAYAVGSAWGEFIPQAVAAALAHPARAAEVSAQSSEAA